MSQKPPPIEKNPDAKQLGLVEPERRDPNPNELDGADLEDGIDDDPADQEES